MKIAVLADVHANSTALTEILNQIEDLKISQVIFLGDLVINGPSPKEVLEQMYNIKPIAWIKGNTDNWFVEIDKKWKPDSITEIKFYELYQFAQSRLTPSDINFINNLPISQSIKINDVKILCVHGSPRHIAESMSPELSNQEILEMIHGVTERIILCGHFHSPTSRFVNNKYIFNPGSVSSPRDKDPRASYGILEISDNTNIIFTVKRVPYAIDEHLKIAKKRNFPHLEEYGKKLRIATEPIL
jgi:putative phosphoesterase